MWMIYNINIFLKETQCEDVDWIHVAQDRDMLFANIVINYFIS
jgi:hypothetical protein